MEAAYDLMARLLTDHFDVPGGIDSVAAPVRPGR